METLMVITVHQLVEGSMHKELDWPTVDIYMHEPKKVFFGYC